MQVLSLDLSSFLKDRCGKLIVKKIREPQQYRQALYLTINFITSYRDYEGLLIVNGDSESYSLASLPDKVQIVINTYFIPMGSDR